MATWLGDVSLKYKFWAVNAVACVTLLALVLYAMHLEQQAASASAQQAVQSQAQLIAQWPAKQALPSASNLLLLSAAQPAPFAGVDSAALARAHGWVPLNVSVNGPLQQLIGASVVSLDGQEKVALLAYAPSFSQIFRLRAASYAGVVCLLMLVLMGASQLLIQFLLSQLNRLKEVMLRVAKSGDLTARVTHSGGDEVGQMVSAFNAMQSSFQQVVSTVAQAAKRLDTDAERLAMNMHNVRTGMLGQQSETDQAATAINQMSATVQHIADYSASTRDQSSAANQLAAAGQSAVKRVGESIAGLSTGVQQTGEMISKLAVDSQKISSVVSEIHGIAEQTNLLALNAAIEAARAGDMGRGFAVVADEVRNLAKRVQGSTSEITKMISALQNGTRDAVEFMQESSYQADGCVQQAAEAGLALNAITQAVAQMRDSNTQIAVAAEQQRQVAEEMNRAVIGIRDVTEQTVQQTRDSAATSEQLAGLAGELSKAIGQLKV
ncbi:MAG: methyl-accepting chemotaxis protein [Pseudomonadaceae bacterium]|jgi:methyl-accepting chemotaxis protein|nr:methyl-accepting chemotaxis protein [Pseudomonadaceae bacterium]